jgi:hypothetical protein
MNSSTKRVCFGVNPVDLPARAPAIFFVHIVQAKRGLAYRQRDMMAVSLELACLAIMTLMLPVKR